jgi:hypothetical protein
VAVRGLIVAVIAKCSVAPHDGSPSGGSMVVITSLLPLAPYSFAERVQACPRSVELVVAAELLNRQSWTCCHTPSQGQSRSRRQQVTGLP